MSVTRSINPAVKKSATACLTKQNLYLYQLFENLFFYIRCALTLLLSDLHWCLEECYRRLGVCTRYLLTGVSNDRYIPSVSVFHFLVHLLNDWKFWKGNKKIFYCGPSGVKVVNRKEAEKVGKTLWRRTQSKTYAVEKDVVKKMQVKMTQLTLTRFERTQLNGHGWKDFRIQGS